MGSFMGFCRRYKLYPIRMFLWCICSTIDCLSLILNLQISNIPQSYLAPPLGFVKNFLNYARPMTIPEGNLTIIHGWIYIAFPRVKFPAVPYILHSFRIRRQIGNPMPENCSPMTKPYYSERRIWAFSLSKLSFVDIPPLHFAH
jgi:hypothetical protein